MKIYLAGPWAKIDECRAAMKEFQDAGISVTSHWMTDHGNDVVDDSKGDLLAFDPVSLTTQAIQDIEDILAADIFVILNLAKSEGKSFEMGVAYAMEIPIILVGERIRNIFYYMPGVGQAASVSEAIKVVQEIGDKWIVKSEQLDLIEAEDEGRLVN